MRVPFLILSFERSVILNDMIKTIEDNTDMNLIDLLIIDNHSQTDTMKILLQQLEKKYHVIRCNNNLGLESFNEGLNFYDMKDYKFFLMSDPDVMLNSNMPKDWPLIITKMMDDFPNVCKIAMALDYNFITDERMKDIYEYEKRLQNYDKAHYYGDIPFFYSAADTTLCLCRNDMMYYWDGYSPIQFKIRDFYIPQSHYNKKYTDGSIRIGGNQFTCRHLGWEINNPRYALDFEEYAKAMKRDGIDNRLASTMNSLLMK